MKRKLFGALEHFFWKTLCCRPDGGPLHSWWYHHTGAGYLEMGERCYAKWQQLVGEVPPPPPPPLVIKINGVPVQGTVKLNGQVIGGPGDVIEVETEAE